MLGQDPLSMSSTGMGFRPPSKKKLVVGVALALTGPVLLLIAIALQLHDVYSVTQDAAVMADRVRFGLLMFYVAIFGGAPASAVGALVLVSWARTERRSHTITRL